MIVSISRPGLSNHCHLLIFLLLIGQLALSLGASHDEDLSEDANAGFCSKDDDDCEEERYGIEFCEGEDEEGCFRDLNPEHQPDTEEYEHLVYLEPDDIENVFDVKLFPGKTHKMTAKAITPPIYEIPNFLTDKECDYLIEKAKATGMSQSALFGDDIDEEMSSHPPDEVSRISNQTWLYNDGDEVIKAIYDRLALLTALPRKYIDDSEAMQVVKYNVGGHYHAHLDSTESSLDDEMEYMRLQEIPCCYQARCDHLDVANMTQCCKLCRYITVLYYLNDVEEGGETAFPFPDYPLAYVEELLESDKDVLNLSKNCHESSVVVKPEKGKAVMWYNHEMDLETALLGESIKFSYHGGCNVIKGTKWIANNWISAPPYEQRDKPSIFNVK